MEQGEPEAALAADAEDVKRPAAVIAPEGPVPRAVISAEGAGLHGVARPDCAPIAARCARAWRPALVNAPPT